jgi:hypothetical protein
MRVSELPPESSTAVAYPRPWRVVAAVLVAVGRANLPAMLAAILLVRTLAITPAMLVRTLVVFTLLPELGAWLVARALTAKVEIGEGCLRVARLGQRIEIPTATITSVVPWAVPLPGPGFSLRIGAEHGVGLAARDPMPLLVRLGDAGVEPATAAARHATLVWAHARAAAGRPRWSRLTAKFPLFALLPTAVLFNAHQHIAYGGLLGQYYLHGLVAYLQTFAVYWVTVSIDLILYASVWRGLGEGVALVAACAAPARAARVRRAVEAGCRMLYYGGVPVLLALRFAPW